MNIARSTRMLGPSTTMTDLKLQALDADDLKVLSAHCQDAVVRIDEMLYLASEKRFALVLNRFDWVAAMRPIPWLQAKTYQRKRAGLRFESVKGVKVQGFDPNPPASGSAAVLTLLAMTYTRVLPDSPEGQIVLNFGGGAAVRLDVGMIEAELRDLGAVWSTELRPDHDAPVTPPSAGSAGSRSGDKSKS